MKTLIRQWLCKHEKTKIVRRLILEEDFGNPKERNMVWIKIWTKCECGKVTYWKS